jgi:hypothetical protein
VDQRATERIILRSMSSPETMAVVNNLAYPSVLEKRCQVPQAGMPLSARHHKQNRFIDPGGRLAKDRFEASLRGPTLCEE